MPKTPCPACKCDVPYPAVAELGLEAHRGRVAREQDAVGPAPAQLGDQGGEHGVGRAEAVAPAQPAEVDPARPALGEPVRQAPLQLGRGDVDVAQVRQVDHGNSGEADAS